MPLLSYGFLLFAGLFILLYYRIPARHQWKLLLAASLVFYLGAGPGGLLCLCVSLFSTFLIALKIGNLTEQSTEEIREKGLAGQEKKDLVRKVKQQQKRLMQLGLFLNFGILLVLKYTNFLLDNVNSLIRPLGYEFEPVRWLLPLGISYYTLQTCGYLIDVCRRKYQPERNLGRYALFVTYFPQMTQGPVCRYDEMREMFSEPHPFSWKNLERGLLRTLFGLFKKMVISDRIAPAALAIAGAPDGFRGAYVWIGMFAYTIWMYGDFTGGIDIIMGVSEMLGITLPENFNHPFFSRSMAEFWRRWHMSLMRWLREYIFFPVSMSSVTGKISAFFRKRFGKGAGRRVPLYLSSITVWLAAGFWHGASWNFVCWGLANCFVLLLAQELSPLGKKLLEKTGLKDGLPAAVQIVRTFLIFCLLEMFEYYPIARIPEFFCSMFAEFRLSDLAGLGSLFAEAGIGTADAAVLCISVLLLMLTGFLSVRKSVRERYFEKPLPVRALILYGLFLSVLIFGVYGQGYSVSGFIYNQY